MLVSLAARIWILLEGRLSSDRGFMTSVCTAWLDPDEGGGQQSRKGSSSEEAGRGKCPALQPEALLTLRVRAFGLMASSGRKLWLRYPSFLLTSPDLPPPQLGKAKAAWVERSEPKAYSENALYCQSGGLAGICLWGAGSNVGNRGDHRIEEG